MQYLFSGIRIENEEDNSLDGFRYLDKDAGPMEALFLNPSCNHRIYNSIADIGICSVYVHRPRDVAYGLYGGKMEAGTACGGNILVEFLLFVWWCSHGPSSERTSLVLAVGGLYDWVF